MYSYVEELFRLHWATVEVKSGAFAWYEKGYI